MLLQALVLEAEERMEGHGESPGREAAFFEVTIASVDQPKLLSRLSEALVRAGANFGWLCCAGSELLVPYCVAQLLGKSRWLCRQAVYHCSCRCSKCSVHSPCLGRFQSIRLLVLSVMHGHRWYAEGFAIDTGCQPAVSTHTGPCRCFHGCRAI